MNIPCLSQLNKLVLCCSVYASELFGELASQTDKSNPEHPIELLCEIKISASMKIDFIQMFYIQSTGCLIVCLKKRPVEFEEVLFISSLLTKKFTFSKYQS